MNADTNVTREIKVLEGINQIENIHMMVCWVSGKLYSLSKTAVPMWITMYDGDPPDRELVSAWVSEDLGFEVLAPLKSLGFSDGSGMFQVDNSGTIIASGTTTINSPSIQFSDYGTGTTTGTAAYALGVDSSGKVIEMPLK